MAEQPAATMAAASGAARPAAAGPGRDAPRVLAEASSGSAGPDGSASLVGLGDVVVRRLFGVGLQLSQLTALVEPHLQARLQAVADELDATIREVRAAVLAAAAGSVP